MEAAGKIMLGHDNYLVWKIEGKTAKLLITAYSSTIVIHFMFDGVLVVFMLVTVKVCAAHCNTHNKDILSE
jgi:hypothetical protein